MKRLWSALCMFALVLALTASTVLAQESAKDKLNRGIELYNNQKYQEAVEVLKDLDVSQLSVFDKDKPALYIKKAEEGLARQQGAAESMAKGEEALVQKKYATALSLFEEAKKLDYLSAADRRRVESLITVAKGGEQEARKETLATLAAAKAAEQAGQKDKAIAGYTAVLAADVILPAADKSYAEQHLAALKGVQPTTTAQAPTAQPGMQPVVVPTDIPKPAEPAPVETEPKDIAPAPQPVAETQPMVMKPVETAPPTEAPAEPVVVPAEPVPAPAEPVEVPQPVVEVQPSAEQLAAVEKQAEAARLVAMAEEALKANDFAAAKMHYTRALAADPQNQAAKTGLEKVEVTMGQGTRSLLVLEGDRYAIEIKRTEAKVREAMQWAKATLDAAKKPEDFEKASDQLRYANRLIDENRYMSPELKEDLYEEVKGVQKTVEDTRDARLKALELQRAKEIEERQKVREEADRLAREKEIQSLWNQSKQLADVRQYKEAATVLDHLLVIDPQHERARRFREDYLYQAGQAASVAIRQERRIETRKILEDVEASTVPHYDLFKYPPVDEWKALTLKRRKLMEQGVGESEAKALTRRKLTTKGLVSGEMWSIPLQFTAAPLSSVLDFIAEVARQKPREINIIVDRKGITDAAIDLDKQITLSVPDLSIEQALKMVMGDELGYAILDDGTVLVSSKQNLTSDLPVRTYFVGDLTTQVPDFGDTVPRMNLQDVLQQGGQGGGGGGGAAGALFAPAVMPETEVSGTQRLKELIERTVRSEVLWESAGGTATLEFYERSGVMIVKQTDEGHARLSQLLESLRRERAIMINVEARFVTVSDSFLNDVTLDFDVAFRPNAAKWGNAQIPTDNLSTLDLGAPPVVPANSVVMGNTMYSQTAGGAEWGTGFLIGPTRSQLFGAGWTPNMGGLVISGIFLDNVQLGFLVRAIQADARSVTLFAPRLTLWNGQRAWISDGTHNAYVSDLTPIVAEAAVAFDPVISWIVSGSVLDVKATASADRRYVQLDLRPQVALPPDFSRSVTISAATPGMGIATTTLFLPTVRATALMTSVSVPDGGTLLIAGMKTYTEMDAETGVPVLSKVPVLKRLFSSRAQVKGAINLLVLVKPTIIIQAEKEAELGVDEVFD